jgi:hypothetical protein
MDSDKIQYCGGVHKNLSKASNFDSYWSNETSNLHKAETEFMDFQKSSYY